MSEDEDQQVKAAGRRKRRRRSGAPRIAAAALPHQPPSAQPPSAQPLHSQPTPAQPRAAQPTRSRSGQRSGRGLPPGRAPKKPPAEPRIGVGCIVLRGDEILMVREKGRWSLPKGGLDAGELVQSGAVRETYEETGLSVEIREFAFVVEFQARTWGHHIQFFYLGRETGGTLGPRDPDREVQEAKFIPLRQLREYLLFR
ncbi:MAG: NUDIX domain-containing protein, partial [Deinococcus sp.]